MVKVMKSDDQLLALGTAPAAAPAPAPGGIILRVREFMRRNKESAVNVLILFILVQIGAIIASLLFPDSFRYLSEANISVQLKAIPVLGIMSLGVGVLMISGEFDLSVGAVYTFTGIVAATLIGDGMSAFAAAPLALILGAGMGLLNGFVTLRFRIPSFIATLGTMLFWQGMTLLYHGATSIRFYPEQLFTDLTAGSIGVIEAAFLWFLVLTAGFWVLLHNHKLGNHFYAVGGNREAATAIGINPDRVKMIAFGLAGFCAAVSGILAAARVGSIQPGQGSGLELQAIAACVIGGLALTGGRGTILGVFLGAALIYTIQDILLLVRAPGFYLDIFVGLLIVGAAIFNQALRQQKR
jgi:simple sugar transport system permease protein